MNPELDAERCLNREVTFFHNGSLDRFPIQWQCWEVIETKRWGLVRGSRSLEVYPGRYAFG